jgi:hypothetical protein
LIIYPLLCNVKFNKDSTSHFFGPSGRRIKEWSFDEGDYGGFYNKWWFAKRPNCPKVHIWFGKNGVNVFQGNKNGVTKQICDNYAPHSTVVHCMAHCIHLVIQTLSGLLLLTCFENLLQILHSYFAHSPKGHLEFTKLGAHVHKGELQNVKTRWISMLNPAKKVMAKCKIMLVKMALNILTN